MILRQFDSTSEVIKVDISRTKNQIDSVLLSMSDEIKYNLNLIAKSTAMIISVIDSA